MRNKKILITGGAGFIGSNLVLTLQEECPENEYFVIDNFSSGNIKNLAEFKGDIITGNLSEMDLSHYLPKGVDVIFHQAALTDTTVFDKNKMMLNNVKSFRNILKLAIRFKTKLIYASSAAVYGHSNPPMKVGRNEEPANMYGSSKLIIDNIARKYFNDIPVIGLRYFNVYGPKEEYKDKMASMVWQLYLQMKKGKRPRIFKYGEQKRDQVYIKDVIKANLLALKTDKSGIFNIGTGKAATFNEIIHNLNKILGTNFEPEYFDNPYKHYQKHTEADLTETKRVLNYRPEYNIKEGVNNYFKNLD